MKQRIRVTGIIENERGILVLKRHQGRSESPVRWELLTGKIKFGEQPEEAIGRALEEYLGIHVVKEIKLSDVVTFLAPQGSSQLSNLYIVYKIRLKSETKICPNERYTAYKYVKLRELGDIRLDEASQAVLEIEDHATVPMNYKDVANSATVYIDGCSRGNPGPSGAGYYIVGENGETLAQGGEFIGFATSRVAEYYALKTGMQKALDLGLKSARFVGDNLMMINQMNGLAKIKNRDLLAIHDDVRKLVEQFEACAFIHVGREQNIYADREANLAVDRQFGLTE